MSRKRKDAFFIAHPNCIFCGGAEKATTIEHCPPRAMFQFRQWPDGFEFPACSSCNHGTADHDLIIALLARTDPFTEAGNRDGRMPMIIESVHQKHPSMIGKMMPNALESRTLNRKLGIVPPPGLTNQEAGPVRVTEEMHRAVEVFAAKLTKAVYYMRTNNVFPSEGRIALKWFTNSELITNQGRYVVFDLLQQLDGLAPALVRSNSLLNDQFEYKISISPDGDILALQARFGNGFGFAVFASTDRAKLDASFESISRRTGKPSPFVLVA
jgi:hypothetical protein